MRVCLLISVWESACVYMRDTVCAEQGVVRSTECRPTALYIITSA